jgi:hypothetical protein
MATTQSSVEQPEEARRSVPHLYRRLVHLAGIQFVAGFLLGVLASDEPTQVQAVLSLVAFAVALVVSIGLAVTAWQLMDEISTAPWLWAIGTFLPFLNYLVLAAIAYEAHTWCKDRGVRVRFFRPSRGRLSNSRTPFAEAARDQAADPNTFITYVVPVLILAGVVVIVALFLKGAMWASEHILPWLVLVALLAAAIDILVLLPLSIVGTLRRFTGGAILASSYVFGLTTWLTGFLFTYLLWGGVAVVIGLFIAGVGVVPMAMLATLFKGMWSELFVLAIMAVMTFGMRVVGLVVANAGTR